MTTPHPEFETLAELADQAGDGPEPATGDQQAAATAEVLAHVAECATCQADLDALRSVRETLRSLPPIPMPADVAERLDAALLAARADDNHPADVVPIKTRPARGAQRNPFPLQCGGRGARRARSRRWIGIRDHQGRWHQQEIDDCLGRELDERPAADRVGHRLHGRLAAPASGDTRERHGSRRGSRVSRTDQSERALTR